MTDNFLKIRATLITYFIADFSQVMVQEVSANLKRKGRVSEHIVIDLDKLPKEKQDKIVFIFAYTLLFNAQRFLWENIIQDEKYGLKFESFLYKEFSTTYHTNPLLHVNDYLYYIKRIGASGEIQYIGSKICDTINIKDAFLMMDIVHTYSALLSNNFYKRLNDLWNMSDKEIEKFYDEFK